MHYAFLMLLATYGLRAGEIVALRLEDIDWQKKILHHQRELGEGSLKNSSERRNECCLYESS